MADGLNSFITQLENPADIAAGDIRERINDAETSGLIRESWKYSRLISFLPEHVQSVEPTVSASAQLLGRRLAGSETSAAEPCTSVGDLTSIARYPLADLGLLVTGDCLIFDLPDGQEAELNLQFLDGFNLPVQINVGAGASLSLIETNAAASFSNHSLYLHLAEDAHVEHARTAFTEACSDWSLTQCIVAERSSYQLQQYLSGGSQRRSETQVVLNGRDASTRLIGAYQVAAGAHLDQQMTVEHRAPDTQSEQQFHGIGAGKGQAVFNGRIHIHPDSPRSNAQLSNRNLALHPDAVINTKPELEIYTDDVKCAHGATIGALSPDSIFYLRSRGIDPVSARQMLCRAFINECIEGPLADSAAAALFAGEVAPSQ